MLKNSCSCFTHQIKGLKGFANTIIFLNKDSYDLRSHSVTSLVEAKDPNNPSSSLKSPTSSTMIKVGVVGTIVLLNKNNQQERHGQFSILHHHNMYGHIKAHIINFK